MDCTEMRKEEARRIKAGWMIPIYNTAGVWSGLYKIVADHLNTTRSSDV